MWFLKNFKARTAPRGGFAYDTTYIVDDNFLRIIVKLHGLNQPLL
jgi:hypothetical protein